MLKYLSVWGLLVGLVVTNAMVTRKPEAGHEGVFRMKSYVCSQTYVRKGQRGIPIGRYWTSAQPANWISVDTINYKVKRNDLVDRDYNPRTNLDHIIELGVIEKFFNADPAVVCNRIKEMDREIVEPAFERFAASLSAPVNLVQMPKSANDEKAGLLNPFFSMTLKEEKDGRKGDPKVNGRVYDRFPSYFDNTFWSTSDLKRLFTIYKMQLDFDPEHDANGMSMYKKAENHVLGAYDNLLEDLGFQEPQQKELKDELSKYVRVIYGEYREIVEKTYDFLESIVVHQQNLTLDDGFEIVKDFINYAKTINLFLTYPQQDQWLLQRIATHKDTYYRIAQHVKTIGANALKKIPSAKRVKGNEQYTKILNSLKDYMLNELKASHTSTLYDLFFFKTMQFSDMKRGINYALDKNGDQRMDHDLNNLVEQAMDETSYEKDVLDIVKKEIIYLKAQADPFFF